AQKNGKILLHQRGPTESLMPGMWELPQGLSANLNGDPILRLQHSITDTDYVALVVSVDASTVNEGSWIWPQAASRLPLTGLARGRRSGSFPWHCQGLRFL